MLFTGPYARTFACSYVRIVQLGGDSILGQDLPLVGACYQCNCSIPQHHCDFGKLYYCMDNASFHRNDRIEHLHSNAGANFVYSPPYSLDLNPIEEIFTELEAPIKRKWKTYEKDPEQGFDALLE